MEKRKNKLDADFVICEIYKIVEHHFPNFLEILQAVDDPRKQQQYSIEDIVFGAVSMFLFKTGSRNSYDNYRKFGKFGKNFEKVFGLSLPSMDAVADVLKQMPTGQLEDLKSKLTKILLEKKVFHKWRFNGYVLVAIDGTGICTFKEKHCDDCLHSESKNGVKTYFHKVLEAKLVTSNGFSISLCTVWIDNEDTNNALYDKQGCESKAFIKLAEKLNTEFPRLKICLCADGLYPKKPFFETCSNNGWKYIVTLKDGNLKGLWKKILFTDRESLKNTFKDDNISYGQDIEWINNIEHNGFTHNWIQCKEAQAMQNGKIKKARFVHLTNIDIDGDNAIQVSQNGRLRWKIEKQGFDQQKNHGYNICHKYCRKSYTGMKNFYQCCQIAHMINQLVEMTKNFVQAKGKNTIKFLWEILRGFMLFGYISLSELQVIKSHRYQIQYKE